MALFRRRRAAVSFDLLPPPRPGNAVPRSKAVTGLPVAVGAVGDGRWVAPVSDPTYGPFHVAGTPYRQDALAKVGSGKRLFHLVRQPDNAHDPTAVQVICDGVHIGLMPGKNSGRYTRAILEIEEAGLQVWVHGQVRRQANAHSSKWNAIIDCDYPDAWQIRSI